MKEAPVQKYQAVGGHVPLNIFISINLIITLIIIFIIKVVMATETTWRLLGQEESVVASEMVSTEMLN